jgi:tetratricopeptide (TPR) repeat protein
LLDASADRIPAEFAGDPETQIELLGTAATIYYEFRDWPRYHELHQKALELARAHYGELHPVVLNALLDDVDEANDDSRAIDARTGLAQVATLIARAGLAQSVVQARWFLEKGRLLEVAEDKVKERIAALRAAVDMFEKTAPGSPDHVSAMNDLGIAYSDAGEFESSAQVLARAISLAGNLRHAAGTGLGQQYTNLGLAYWNLARYDDAERAFARAAGIVLETVGPGDPRYWESAIPYARILHQRGALQQAHASFEEILRGVPRHATGIRSAREITAAAYVREMYATCLVIEGRAAEAIPALEDAVDTYRHLKSVEFDLRRARLSLGDAYAAVGRLAEARIHIKAARDDFVAHDVADGFATLRARELWARLLARSGETAAAEREFNAIVELDHHRRLAPTALAYGGLAEIALARKDQAAALNWSQLALAGIEGVTGMRDARMRPYLEVIRARVLLRSGDAPGAARLANDAVVALRRFDDPSSRDILTAENLLRASTGPGEHP